MTRKVKFYIVTILFLLMGQFVCIAADSLSIKYPRVILVQLKSEQNRINALIESKKNEDVERVKKDAIKARSAMVNDFKDNFHFCTVYFFIDTNLDLVKQKKFDNILLTSDQTPANDVSIDSLSTDYSIVFYGRAVVQMKNERVVNDQDRYLSNYGEPAGRGLVVNNNNCRQIDYVYTLGYNESLITKENKRYFFSSKKFDIEYFPLAAKLNRKLEKAKMQ